MDDNIDTTPISGDDNDPVLAAAGARLRRQSTSISPSAIEVAVLRRRGRRLGTVAIGLVVVVTLLGGLLVAGNDSRPASDLASKASGAPDGARVEQFLASLGAEPIDPTRVQLVSTVSTFPDCDTLIGDLRRVGAEHVGSRGFGEFSQAFPGLYYESAERAAADSFALGSIAAAPADGTTLGTNVQVAGVDELDFVKAIGNLVFDLDGKGNLRITDAGTLEVLSTLDVTPTASDAGGQSAVQELLVQGGRVAVFGTDTKVSEPVEGDPSATRASTNFMTVTFVDATDPSKPTVTDRVRIEGSLVSARLVDGEIRLVTTSDMADLGFVMPTTPTSVSKALEQNRRSVATSSVADWIPDWQRTGEDPQPLVPCARVHVPDTFSGVAMTSMVTVPLGPDRFQPDGTSILAPATTLYAGPDKVAISSEVWVDPVDRERLKFDDWQTAVHEFTFTDDSAPTYEGSGIVDGSTIGQFAFGEIGASLAVVTTKGTPWQQDPKAAIDLTILSPDGDGGLTKTATIADLADGKGEVSAVRFVEGRVLISTGFFGREVHVIDVTNPAAPRRAGSVDVPGTVGYFHPLPDQRALVVGSRTDEVGEGVNRQTRSWVRVELLDVSDVDAPRIAATWERPWAADAVASDHHAFTFWPERNLAMWGIRNSEPESGGVNYAIALSTEGGVTEVAAPPASKPNETPSPCPVVDVTDPDAKRMIGPGGVVLRCDDKALKELEWPRYQCNRIDDGILAMYAPNEVGQAALFLCSPAPQPTVSRVLVVSGRPLLLTDQTLEALDPTTFQSTAIAFHPTSQTFGF